MTDKITTKTRIESDSMGDVLVPEDALYGAQTQRAKDNFQFSPLRMPPQFIRTLALIKWACADVNEAQGSLPAHIASAIQTAALEVASGRHATQFPLDIFQTGSGTSSNMNINEVIATVASRHANVPVHPNDHVNMAQSSNDTIPTALQMSAYLAVDEQLLPALRHLRQIIMRRAEELKNQLKTGRTHLMDALPITFGQELTTWALQVRRQEEHLHHTLSDLARLSQGGTVLGTGVNAPDGFAEAVVQRLAKKTEKPFCCLAHPAEGIAAQDTVVSLSGNLNTLAVTLTKIANDLRLMNSGPYAGLGEIKLPPLQPGSSIMPGKINPVIPEAVVMACAQVMGQHVTCTLAGQGGQLQLNATLPLLVYNVLSGIGLLQQSALHLADKAILGFEVQPQNTARMVHHNPVLVTALNPFIGYEQGAVIAKLAYESGESIFDVARRETNIDETTLRRLLDPARLAQSDLSAPMDSK